MKTQVIPAQITTVEDKIVGSLSFTQLLLLMVPVGLAGVIYILLPPMMSIAWYKLVLLICLSLPFVILSLRIKGVLVVEWLQLVGSYLTRPKVYVADKNDGTFRTLPVVEKKARPATKKIVLVKPKAVVKLSSLSLVQFEQQLALRKLAVRVVPSSKGGVHVVLD